MVRGDVGEEKRGSQILERVRPVCCKMEPILHITPIFIAFPEYPSVTNMYICNMKNKTRLLDNYWIVASA